MLTGVDATEGPRPETGREVDTIDAADPADPAGAVSPSGAADEAGAPGPGSETGPSLNTVVATVLGRCPLRCTMRPSARS